MSKSSLTVRPHFLYVFSLLYPYLTLLIIPVIKGVIQYFYGNGGRLSAFLLAECSLLLSAVVLAIIKLRRYKITFLNGIHVKKGLFLEVSYTVLPRKPIVIMLESHIILRLFGACRLKIYTESGLDRRPDESIPIDTATAKRLLEMLGENGQRIKSSTKGNVIMSAALSSSTTGLLLGFPIVKIVASALGEGVSTMMPRIKSSGFTLKLAEAGKILPFLLVGGYVVSFFALLLRNTGFSMQRKNGKLRLESGILPHRTTLLRADSVNAVKLVTAPLMLIAKRCAIKFSACGFGQRSGEIGVLVPCVSPSVANGMIAWLLPSKDRKEEGIAPSERALRRCSYLPILIAVTVVFFTVTIINPERLTGTVAVVLGIVLGVDILFWVLRIYIIKKGAFSLQNGLRIKHLSGLKVVEMQCDLDRVQCILIRRTPFDKITGQSSVKVRLFGKNRDRAALRFLNYSEVIGEINKL